MNKIGKEIRKMRMISPYNEVGLLFQPTKSGILSCFIGNNNDVIQPILTHNACVRRKNAMCIKEFLNKSRTHSTIMLSKNIGKLIIDAYSLKNLRGRLS
jgi:hypothetical protein